jgi:hypothetical protein
MLHEILAASPALTSNCRQLRPSQLLVLISANKKKGFIPLNVIELRANVRSVIVTIEI